MLELDQTFLIPKQGNSTIKAATQQSVRKVHVEGQCNKRDSIKIMIKNYKTTDIFITEWNHKPLTTLTHVKCTTQ